MMCGGPGLCEPLELKNISRVSIDSLEFSLKVGGYIDAASAKNRTKCQNRWTSLFSTQDVAQTRKMDLDKQSQIASLGTRAHIA